MHMEENTIEFLSKPNTRKGTVHSFPSHIFSHFDFRKNHCLTNELIFSQTMLFLSILYNFTKYPKA